jgi:hypothetical protein
MEKTAHDGHGRRNDDFDSNSGFFGPNTQTADELEAARARFTSAETSLEKSEREIASHPQKTEGSEEKSRAWRRNLSGWPRKNLPTQNALWLKQDDRLRERGLPRQLPFR